MYKIIMLVSALEQVATYYFPRDETIVNAISSLEYRLQNFCSRQLNTWTECSWIIDTITAKLKYIEVQCR
jgi:hypothetical protein